MSYVLASVFSARHRFLCTFCPNSQLMPAIQSPNNTSLMWFTCVATATAAASQLQCFSRGGPQFAAFLSSEIALFAEKGLGTFHRTADLCERSPVLSNQRDKVVLSVYCFSYIRSEIGESNATPSTFARYVIADSIVHCEDVCGYSSSVNISSEISASIVSFVLSRIQPEQTCNHKIDSRRFVPLPPTRVYRCKVIDISTTTSLMICRGVSVKTSVTTCKTAFTYPLFRSSYFKAFIDVKILSTKNIPFLIRTQHPTSS